jgi:hypothetical protein
MRIRKAAVLAFFCAIVLSCAAPAFAQTPAQSAYSGVGAGSVSQTDGTLSSESSSTLPFTGINVGAIAMLGFVLAGTGIVLRRQAKPDAD